MLNHGGRQVGHLEMTSLSQTCSHKCSHVGHVHQLHCGLILTHTHVASSNDESSIYGPIELGELY
jgi:hypothetical protein